tara:strand:- start:1606 stop:1863 length:258 start_codon:yes stop_codon:yes gene_type:complete
MSSEVHKYIETALEKRESLFNADVINFPKEQKISKTKNLETNKNYVWKLYDKSNQNEDGDQLNAVIGVCFMFTVLTLLGLYSIFL